MLFISLIEILINMWPNIKFYHFFKFDFVNFIWLKNIRIKLNSQIKIRKTNKGFKEKWQIKQKKRKKKLNQRNKNQKKLQKKVPLNRNQPNKKLNKLNLNKLIKNQLNNKNNRIKKLNNLNKVVNKLIKDKPKKSKRKIWEKLELKNLLSIFVSENQVIIYF